jgi:hypothetical protein
VFFQKTIYKVKIIDLKNQIMQSELKSSNFRMKNFYLKTSKWQKVSHQEKINLKIANLSKCTDPLISKTENGADSVKFFPKRNLIKSNLRFLVFYLQVYFKMSRGVRRLTGLMVTGYLFFK